MSLLSRDSNPAPHGSPSWSPVKHHWATKPSMCHSVFLKSRVFKWENRYITFKNIKASIEMQNPCQENSKFKMAKFDWISFFLKMSWEEFAQWRIQIWKKVIFQMNYEWEKFLFLNHYSLTYKYILRSEYQQLIIAKYNNLSYFE